MVTGVQTCAFRSLYYRGVGRDVTRENHQNLLLRLESDIVKLLQELDAQGQDESVVVREVITLVCRTLNWVCSTCSCRRS